VGRDIPIISKIEKPEALTSIEGILEASDAIMIARGDLGVELPPEQVPNVQEELVDLARARNKPVIVATQMLESMMEHPRPTRAEVTDVANAVRSGADAVMLSGETAAGAYPVEAVRMMDTIVRQTEAYLFSDGAFSTFDLYTPTQAKPEPPLSIDRAVANSAALLSRELLVRGLVVMTRTGRSIEVMSSARPAAPLVGVSSDPAITGFGCLMWGVIPVTVADWEQRDAAALASELALKLRLADEGGSLLVVRGFNADPANNTPSIGVIPLGATKS
jgi:pyruvate kinase